MHSLWSYAIIDAKGVMWPVDGNRYDKALVRVHKGELEKVREEAALRGMTLNEFINALLAENVPGFRPLGTRKK